MADTIKPYGCYNRRLVTSYQVPVRDINNAGNLVGYKVITLRNTMSQDCRYDLRSTDVRCSNCAWIDTIPMPF